MQHLEIPFEDIVIPAEFTKSKDFTYFLWSIRFDYAFEIIAVSDYDPEFWIQERQQDGSWIFLVGDTIDSAVCHQPELLSFK